MITKEYKEFAEEFGLRTSAGVAYGSLNGYAATMYCTGKKKALAFVTRFSDPVGQANLNDAIEETNPTAKFLLSDFSMAPDRVLIAFRNLPDDLSNIRAFLEWFLPLLSSSGASPYNLCPECGFLISDGEWKLVGDTACYVHASCEERVILNYSSLKRGSYITGALGALIGAAIGTALWIAFQTQGYLTAAASLAVGVLTGWGYNLLYGRKGKGRFTILGFLVVFGVVIGTFAPDYLTFSEAAYSEDIFQLQALQRIWGRLCMDSDYMWKVIRVFVSGILFASCGSGVMIEKTEKSIKKHRVIDLP